MILQVWETPNQHCTALCQVGIIIPPLQVGRWRAHGFLVELDLTYRFRIQSYALPTTETLLQCTIVSVVGSDDTRQQEARIIHALFYKQGDQVAEGFGGSSRTVCIADLLQRWASFNSRELFTRPRSLNVSIVILCLCFPSFKHPSNHSDNQPMRGWLVQGAVFHARGSPICLGLRII